MKFKTSIFLCLVAFVAISFAAPSSYAQEKQRPAVIDLTVPDPPSPSDVDDTFTSEDQMMMQQEDAHRERVLKAVNEAIDANPDWSNWKKRTFKRRMKRKAVQQRVLDAVNSEILDNVEDPERAFGLDLSAILSIIEQIIPIIEMLLKLFGG